MGRAERKRRAGTGSVLALACAVVAASCAGPAVTGHDVSAVDALPGAPCASGSLGTTVPSAMVNDGRLTLVIWLRDVTGVPCVLPSSAEVTLVDATGRAVPAAASSGFTGPAPDPVVLRPHGGNAAAVVTALGNWCDRSATAVRVRLALGPAVAVSGPLGRSRLGAVTCFSPSSGIYMLDPVPVGQVATATFR